MSVELQRLKKVSVAVPASVSAWIFSECQPQVHLMLAFRDSSAEAQEHSIAFHG